MESKKNNTGLVVFIIIIVLAVLCGVAGVILDHGVFNLNNSKFSSINDNEPSISIPFKKSSKKGVKVPKSSYIAKIDIKGTIEESGQTYNQKWMLETIRKLKDDQNNKGIILFIDSPGGAVYESDETYLALLDYKAAGKPVYAYMGSMAASGGYYISCAADYICANRNTLTGSIGVIAGNSIDITGLLDNLGIKYTTIHAGKNKNMGNYNEPLSEEQKQILQSVADECYEQFTGIVAESRKMPLEKVQSLADGRVYTAKQALSNGLIDSIGSWDDIVYRMRQYELENQEVPVVEFAYVPNETIYDFIKGAVSSIGKAKASSSFELPDVVNSVLESKVPFPAYYYDAQR